uniref:Leucine-rich repeat-containing protein 69-like n=1 Tax=Saccoglossus kowalevskii TaxID=10224 RepID=A0ABM0M706_SACKO|nr:PREDICTED: leucine-rich repeat-containing protein 69-like [Saccoglossus kowalevskii]
MGSRLGSYVTTFLTDSIFHSGDVQATGIAVCIVSMLCFSLICFLIGLLFGKPPGNNACKKKKYLVRTVSRGCQFGRSRPSFIGSKKAIARFPKQKNSVIVSCRELPRQLNNVACLCCKIVAAKKNCRYTRCGSCCRGNKASICHAHGTGGTAAQGIVEGACQDKPTELDLSYLNLKRCPDRIGYIGSQLVSLNLSNNRLASLPDEIGFLRGLEEFFLQYNCLTELPNSIGNLQKLVELDCKNNRIRRLPNTLGNMTCLSILNVTNNGLQSFPSSIGKLHELEELCAQKSSCDGLLTVITHEASEVLLEVPILLYYRLKAIPDQMGRLNQLKELHVRNNQIRYFPASLSYLQLYTFSANHNPLIEEWNIESILNLSVQPSQVIPPLSELSARCIVKNDVYWSKGDVPTALEDMLLNVRQCSSCEGPFFKHYKSQVVFSNVGVFHRVPLYQQICSPYYNTHCQPVDTK